jgi:hypothetical protein
VKSQRGLLAVFALLSVWGCDDVVGAGDYSVGAEGGAGPDGAGVDAPARADSTNGIDASEGSTPSDGTSPPEAEAAVEASPCGSLSSTDNCSACGDRCAGPSQSVASDSCNGVSCVYTCEPVYLDCNASIAPDLDGCECAVPAGSSCCGTRCPVQHNNGLGQTFYDCVPFGTYNITLAMDACNVFAPLGHGGICQGGTCGSDTGVWNYQSADCAGWIFSGPDQGIVHNSFGTSCDCPVAGDPFYE